MLLFVIHDGFEPAFRRFAFDKISVNLVAYFPAFRGNGFFNFCLLWAMGAPVPIYFAVHVVFIAERAFNQPIGSLWQHRVIDSVFSDYAHAFNFKILFVGISTFAGLLEYMDSIAAISPGAGFDFGFFIIVWFKYE